MRKNKSWIVLAAALLGVGLWSMLRAGTGAEAAIFTPTAEIAAERSIYAAGAAPVITVYKSASCACCGDWADHLRESGFGVEIVDGDDVAETRAGLGVPFSLLSCHSATVDGYVLEGHVPADVIGQLLSERPRVTGLAVPGMPEGVPGMPAAGPNRRPYEVIAFASNGRTQLYATR